MKVMFIQDAIAHFFVTVVCFFLFAAVLATGTVSAAFVAEWNEDIVFGNEGPSSPRITLPLFDAQNLRRDNNTTRCGEAPIFPVGEQTLVTMRTAAGAQRKFVLYIPKAYAQRKNSAVALKLLFHGLNERCDSFLNATGFVALAEKDGYILASLCGSWGFLGVGWNSGTCCGFFSDQSPDDFDFARSVVDLVATGTCVDREKVMAVGFSNGGMMAEVLGCREPSLFRVVASVSGVVELRPGNEGGLEACARDIRTNNTVGRRPSVLLVHGELDLVVPVGGNRLLGFPPLKMNTENWAQINGCNKNANVTIATKNYTNELYAHCDSSAAGKHDRLSNLWRRVKNTVDKYFWRSSPENLRLSIVEVVHALNVGHAWPADEEFNTTHYIYEFGKRVFSSY